MSMAMRELLGGVLRFFPNTMLMTTLVGGILLGRLPWILVGVGALLLSVLVLTIQYVFEKSLNIGPMPGTAVLDACALIPVVKGGTYTTTPSLWMALTAFFIGYIATNAAVIYTTVPSRRNKDSLPVQQRKGVGLISMLAIALLGIFLVGVRASTSCESWFGTTLGVAIGVFWGWAWWKILNACGSTVFPDIHGVMLSLKPAGLHTNPKVCLPTK